MSTGIIDFGSTTLRSDEIVADTHLKIGATTPATNVKLHATGTAPQIRLQDTASGTASGALVCDSGAFQFQTGADFTNNAVGEFRFASVGGTHKFLTIKGNNSDVTESNVAVGGDLIVDSDSHLKGSLGVNTVNFIDDEAVCRIRASTTDPAKPTLHVFDSAFDGGDYGMVQLTRDGTSPGNKAHLAFIRNTQTVLGMGFHNNTNTFGLFPSLDTNNGVTATPGLAITSDSKVGIATSAPQEALHVNGNIRLGGPSGTDANDNVHIKSTSQILITSAESDTNSQYCFLGLRAGTSTNLGSIDVGGGANTGERSIVFKTSNSEASRIDASGYWKHSKMPRFMAQFNVSADTSSDIGTNTPIVFNLTHENIGSCYSTSTGKFTAPVDGVYVFSFNVYINGEASTTVSDSDTPANTHTIDGYRQLALMMESPSNPTLTFQPMDQSFLLGGTNYGATHFTTIGNARAMGMTAIVKLKAAQKVGVGFRTGSSKVYRGHSSFCGYLLSTV